MGTSSRVLDLKDFTIGGLEQLRHAVRGMRYELQDDKLWKQWMKFINDELDDKFAQLEKEVPTFKR